MKDWLRYISRLAAVNQAAADQMQKFIDANGIDDVAALIQYANALTTKYGEAAAAASCDMYDAIAEAQGASVPPAVPARTPSMKETANVIQSALDRAPTTIPDETGKLVKKTATRTMRKNAVRDNAQMALVPSGDGCSFCKMLGSRGWEDARAAKSFEAHLHKNCRCEYVVRFGNDLNVEGYDPDALYDEFMQYDGDWNQKMNAMRRDYRAEHKDEINAQKRAAYASRKQLQDQQKGDIIKLRINFFDTSDPLYWESFSIEEEEGFEDVCGHGNPSAFEITIDGVKKALSAQEFAEHIIQSGDFKGQDLRFVSCAVGQGDDCFAQQLSKILGIKVKAPDADAFYAPEEGVVFIGSPYRNIGKWRVFDKGVEIT